MTVTSDRTKAAAHGADAVRRRALADFLRNRRERLTPDALGIPDHGRRRTPGLRREEVAAHAGVGVTWYTWLEQARDINVSEQVLDAISRTLLLDPHERGHLFTLAGSPLPVSEPEAMPVTPEVRQLLDKLNPYPAYVMNARMDLLAYNHAYTVIIGDFDELPFEQRNIAWLSFTNPLVRALFSDPQTACTRMVGTLRNAMADHVGDPAWKCFIKRLSEASPEFAEQWSQHEVMAPANLAKRFQHPELGVLRFTFTNLWVSQKLGMRLVTYTPNDPETELRLEEISTMVPRSLVVPAA